MPWRPRPKNAEVNPSSPRMWATCDGCGQIYNHEKLGWQFDWAGFVMINRRLLHCPKCMDDPSVAKRSIIIPPDPDPQFNARPEQYSIDEGLIAKFTASIAPTDGLAYATMTVTGITSGVVSTGAALTGTGVSAGTTVGDQLTGQPPAGGLGTYAVRPVQTVPSTLMSTD